MERGEPDTFELTWRTGHIERIKAHQVSYPNNYAKFQGDTELPEIIEFHGEINGLWRLVLRTDVSDIRTIRNVTHSESELL